MAKLPRFAEALPGARPSSSKWTWDSDFILDLRFFNSLLVITKSHIAIFRS
jgi:hypothetical protein